MNPSETKITKKMLRTEIVDLVRENSGLIAEIHKLSGRVKQRTKLLEVSRNCRKVTRARLRTAEQQYRDATKNLDVARSRVNEDAGKISQLRTKVELTTRNFNAALRREQDLRSELKASESEEEFLEQKLAKADDSVATLTARCNCYEESMCLARKNLFSRDDCRDSLGCKTCIQNPIQDSHELALHIVETLKFFGDKDVLVEVGGRIEFQAIFSEITDLLKDSGVSYGGGLNAANCVVGLFEYGTTVGTSAYPATTYSAARFVTKENWDAADLDDYVVAFKKSTEVYSV